MYLYYYCTPVSFIDVNIHDKLQRHVYVHNYHILSYTFTTYMWSFHIYIEGSLLCSDTSCILINVVILAIYSLF